MTAPEGSHRDAYKKQVSLRVLLRRRRPDPVESPSGHEKACEIE